MSLILAAALTLHLLAVLIWVGGMFFAHMVLRPVIAEQLEPPQRLALMKGVFERFFPWVWGAVVLLLVTGFWVFLGPFQAKAGLYVHLMTTIGLVMAAIFFYIYFVPYRKMSIAIVELRMPDAADALALIRKLILINLILGMVTSVIAVAGRYLVL